MNVDFLPERIKQQRARKRRIRRQAVLLVLCAGVMTALGFVYEDRIQGAQAELALLDDRMANTKQQLAMRQDLEREQAGLAIKQRIDTKLGSRVSPLDILAEISRIAPKSVSLTRLSVEAMEVPESGEPAAIGKSGRARRAKGGAKTKIRMVKRVRLTISGLAPNDVDVANLIGQLSACPLFEDVHMGYAKTIEFRGQEAREFQAICYVAP